MLKLRFNKVAMKPDENEQAAKWARDCIHHVHTFVGAPEVQEFTQRNKRRQLIKLMGELKAENC
jgi:hypothetical protein